MGKKSRGDDRIVVPAKVRKRAGMALDTGSATVWVDQALWLIGHNVTHRRPGEPYHYDDAVQAAESLLALLVELRRREIG